MFVLHYITTLGVWAQSHPWTLLYVWGGVFALVLFVWLVRGGKGQGDAQSHGSARWATRREIRKAGLFARDGVILGKHGSQVLRAGRGHVLLVGPTGSGKEVGHNLPTTMRWPGSMVILDVKDGGENYNLCAAYRPGNVYRFAPTMRQSHCLNLLDHVRVGTPEEFRDVAVIVESHCAPRKQQHITSDSGQYFARQASLALRTVILHMLHTQPRKSMDGVLAYMSDASACVQSLATSHIPSIRDDGKRFADMQKRAPKQFEGIWDSAMGVLDIYRDPLVAAHTETSDFSLADIAADKGINTLYLIANAPTEMEYLYPLFRSTLQLFLHYRMERAVSEDAQSELLLLLNEFPTLGYMAPVEAAISVARSYGMRFLIALQDLGQLFDVYGHNTPLWGNCTVKVFHAPTNDETALRIARMLGNQTVSSGGQSRTSGQGRRTYSEHSTGRPLLDAAEVLGLSQDVALVMVQGLAHPICASKLRYYSDHF